MTAVDTNILVRLLTADDPKQSAAARSLFTGGQIWIAKTVLLEAGWMLRSIYKFHDAAIVDAFTKLLGLKNVHAEDESSIATALSLAAQGLDLADALHLSSKPPGVTFVSFDRSFVRAAQGAGASHIAELS